MFETFIRNLGLTESHSLACSPYKVSLPSSLKCSLSLSKVRLQLSALHGNYLTPTSRPPLSKSMVPHMHL